jgi:hypothetical protein
MATTLVLQGSATHPCLLIGNSQQYVVNGKNYTLNGTSEYAKCQTLAASLLFSDDKTCMFDNCAIAGFYQPVVPADTKFVATTNYAQYATNLNCSDVVSCKAATVRVCGMTYAQAQAAYPRGGQYLYMYCLRSNWAWMMLDAFKIDSKNVLLTSSINGQPIDWTLGAMLYVVNSLPFEMDDFGIDCLNNKTVVGHLIFLLVVRTLGVWIRSDRFGLVWFGLLADCTYSSRTMQIIVVAVVGCVRLFSQLSTLRVEYRDLKEKMDELRVDESGGKSVGLLRGTDTL